MINVGIVGASGYAGEELNKILSKHSGVRVVYLAARQARKNFRIKKFNLDEVISVCDLVFFALPHTESMKFVPHVLEAEKKVIDLGADYRLKNISEYEQWYKVKHLDKKNVKVAVYGLPEVYRKIIKKANFIANPGCYPTAAILSLLPLFRKKIIKSEPIVIDAKSGLSGAGRRLFEEGLVDELKENFKPYKINRHQHMPEINQELSLVAGEKIAVNFVPHLLPIFKGLLTTIYVKIAGRSLRLSEGKLRDLYRTFYKDESFVRVVSEGRIPQVRDVAETNFCDIGIFFEGKNKMLVIVSVIDNLIKGAAGQAVQNMNVMYGFTETEALS